MPEIDFLRGLSAFGVVLFHSRVNLWVGFREINANPDSFSTLDRVLSWWSLPVSQMGYLVMLFFVISGFCIHLPHAGRTSAIDLRCYSVRRFFRIFPPYALTLALCFFVEVAFQLAGKSHQNGVGIFLASFAMVQNYLFQGSQIASNPSLWSIPVEVELYIAYPMLVFLLRHQAWGIGAGWLVTAVFSAAAAIGYAVGWSWPDTNFLKFWCIWWSGAWLAERWRGNSIPPWGGFAWSAVVCTIGTLVAGMIWNWDHAYMHFVWGALSFLALWRCLCPRKNTWHVPRIATWLCKAGVNLGVISYSLYLVHFPVLQLLGLLWQKWIGGKPNSFVVPVLGSILCVSVAWGFYQLVERPSHLLGRKLTRS